MIIAIDGVAGAGKSTVSKILAKRTDFNYLYSGALYRACAFKFIELGFGIKDINEKNLKILIDKMNLKIQFIDKIQQTILDGKVVDDFIHTAQISKITSLISQFMIVRDFINHIQIDAAKKNNLIVEGRDIGSCVFPDAEFKFFLTATPEARALRRFSDFEKIGNNKLSFEEVLNAIKERDIQDSTRENCPLKLSNDAILIDSSNLSVEQVVQVMLEVIQKKD